MFNGIILPFAKQDIKDAADWYNTRQKGLGRRFTSEVNSKVNTLKSDPYICPIRYDNLRTAVLDVFPFMIHYIISETEHIIVITAILHTSRNPAIWTGDRDTDNEK